MTEYGWNPDLENNDFRFWRIKDKHFLYPLELQLYEKKQEDIEPLTRFDLLDIPE